MNAPQPKPTFEAGPLFDCIALIAFDSARQARRAAQDLSAVWDRYLEDMETDGRPGTPDAGLLRRKLAELRGRFGKMAALHLELGAQTARLNEMVQASMTAQRGSSGRGVIDLARVRLDRQCETSDHMILSIAEMVLQTGRRVAEQFAEIRADINDFAFMLAVEANTADSTAEKSGAAGGN